MLKSSHGFQNLLKEVRFLIKYFIFHDLSQGYRHYSGLEEAIMKNIEACKDIAKMCRTSLGPNGFQSLFITK